MKRYASVVVDLSAGALDRVFSYRVPEDMEVSAGYQVLVPFGARQLSGFVVGLSDHADLPDERIRPLLGAMQPYPVILPELIELADWLHGRYLCNLVDALRLMIPSELRSGRVRELKRRYARLTLSDAQVEAYICAHGRAKRQIEVLRALQRCGEMPSAQLDAAALRALVQNGAVELREVGLRRTPSALRGQTACGDFELMPGQKRAVQAVTAAMDAGGGRFLLSGVTGSGKTEVYIHIIRHALAGRARRNRTGAGNCAHAANGGIGSASASAIPPQCCIRGFRRANNLTSGAVSASVRRAWWSARARAIFAPMERIGVIIVDEEHEQRLSIRRADRAMMRARWLGNARKWIVPRWCWAALRRRWPALCAPCPGVRAENRLELLELRTRVKDRPMPRSGAGGHARRTASAATTPFFLRALRGGSRDACLAAGDQAMLFINRRGLFQLCFLPEVRLCGQVPAVRRIDDLSSVGRTC